LKNRPVKQKLSCFYSFVDVLQDIFQAIVIVKLLCAGQDILTIKISHQQFLQVVWETCVELLSLILCDYGAI